MPLPAIDTNRELGKSHFLSSLSAASEMNIIKDSKGCDSALMNVIHFFSYVPMAGKVSEKGTCYLAQ